MNALDIILLIPILYGLYSGYTKGLIQQLTGLLAIVLALLFSIRLSGYVIQFLEQNEWVNEGWRGVIGFSIAFIGILIAVKLVGFVLRKTTKTIGLGFIESLLGAAFGAAKAFLVTLVLLFFFVKINRFAEIVQPTVFEESTLFPYYEMGFEYLYEFWKPDTNPDTNITFS